MKRSEVIQIIREEIRDILHDYDSYIELTVDELDWDEHLEPIRDYEGIHLPNPKDPNDPILITNKASLTWYKNHVQNRPILVSTDPKDPAKHKVKFK